MIYLDYAATAAVRPPAVIEAVTRYLTDVGATPGRSGHHRAVEAGRITLRCRRALAKLFGIPGDPGRIAFQHNATHALNTALSGFLAPGDRLVRTGYDHNAVRRPAAALEAAGVQVDVVPARPDGVLDLQELRERVAGGSNRRAAKLVTLPLVSNVLGQRLPVSEVAAIAHDAGARLLVDAAQAAGHLPIDVDADGIDLLAFTGHKGLLGPQGIGGLWVRDGIHVAPLLRGGTGGDSLLEEMPAGYPDHLEAGTLNGPGIAGLLAGTEWILKEGQGRVAAREQRLRELLISLLEVVPEVDIRSPRGEGCIGIVTFTSRRYSSSGLARRLDAEFGVLCRAGLHCAPEVHAALGTLESGAVRFSLGWASTEAEVREAALAVRALHDGGPGSDSERE